jgi:hypothetical protein
MLLGELSQPDALNTDSRPSTQSTLAYGKMSDGTVLDDPVASPTTIQESSSSVVIMSSPSVVVPILSEIVVDPTSTFSMTTGTAWATTSSVSLTNNDANHYEDTQPDHPPNPMTTTRALAEAQCSQRSAITSKFRRQAPNNPSCGPDGPWPNGLPSSGPPLHETPPVGPTYTPSESLFSSSSATGINASPAAGTSSVPSTRFPPLPPLLQWYQCVVITIFAVSGCIYLVRRWRKLEKAQPKLEYIDGPIRLMYPGYFTVPVECAGPKCHA